jgi:perosamine synthetase
MSPAAIIHNIPVAKPYLGVEEETQVLEALRSGWVSQGPRVAEFEKRFAEYVGAAEAVAVSSCTTALHLALASAGVGPGDEVVCPSLSFIATANAIVHTGAKPVFADIDARTYNIDPGQIERAITPRTKAILVVHQIGLPCALQEISAIAERRGLILIEDAACAIGSSYKGMQIGSPHGLMA